MARWRWQAGLVVIGALCAILAGAQDLGPLARRADEGTPQPTGPRYPVVPLDAVPVVMMPELDRAALSGEDDQRAREGLAPRFAIPQPVEIHPATDGLWESLDPKTDVWRLRITSPGALSLNLGFTRYWMPDEGRLFIYAADGSYVVGPFTAHDNAEHGELWTPVVLASDIVVEVTLPTAERNVLDLLLSSINIGYRGFGELLSETSGACNVDVICPEGDAWRDEIPAIGVISTGGSLFCSGFMVNNTAQDQTPFFMTASHCGINSSNAASLVVYWNFESPTCDLHGGGSLSEYQTGSYFRAAYSSSDFTLVQLDESPNPAWGIAFAGWDRSTADPTSATCIHHPNCDEKSISFTYQPCTTTSYLGTSTPGDGTHIRVTYWDVGTTEPGSSGSPLFDPNHHVVGQLHGGYAACYNTESDWFGRFSRSWTGGGSNSTRLSNWLDPGGTGYTTVDTLVPVANGLRVTPLDGLSSSGQPGGPFTPGSITYTLENIGADGIDYAVSQTQSWVSLTNPSGHLAGGATAAVSVSINSSANSLPVGNYTDTVSFVNLTQHVGDTTRPVSLQVGGPSLIYSFPMDANPGWATQGLWAFGHPTGGGGEHGHPDPTNGHTGSNVYGYNLSGDYENSLPQRNLTTTALDCSNLTSVRVKFWRWLGVEQHQYDHAYFKVSNDGANWQTFWENNSEVADLAWVSQEFNIGVLADGRPTVYLRWTMGTTDGSYRYCGWNIDDVEIWGVPACTPPTVTAHPQSQRRRIGQSVTFSVTANGTSPLAYRWRHNGSDIGGAIGTAYTINAVAMGDAGDYDCVVANGCGSVTSNVAVLTVRAAGDVNGDGAINNFDISAFVYAATHTSAQFDAAYPDACFWCADVNGDGSVDNFDISPFVALLASP